MRELVHEHPVANEVAYSRQLAWTGRHGAADGRGMRPSATADAIYARFAERPGSDHIASANAINVLLWTVARWKPTRVLEVGAGIGTLTYTVLQSRPAARSLCCIEADPFCVDALRTNVAADLDRVDLVATSNEVGAARRFELIVVDGGEAEPFAQWLARGGVIFVEGDRAAQRRAIEESARPFERCVVRSTRRARTGGPVLEGQRWEGGCTVYKFEPTGLDQVTMRAVHAWNGSRLVDYRRRLISHRRALGRPPVLGS
jgi:predicted O-methyltransferase YrrM